MANRPTFIDLRSRSHGPIGAGMPSPRGSPKPFPSPRLPVAGDIPPDLSPLDAFAAQSRLLARQLEESMNDGKRMSRLPPLTIENHLAQRPNYLRSTSADPGPSTIYQEFNEGSGQNAEVETPGFRPVSVHPQLSGVASPAFGFQKTAPTPTSRLQPHVEDEEELFRGRRLPDGQHYPEFGIRTEESPAPIDQTRTSDNALGIEPRPSTESMRQTRAGRRRPHDVSLGINGYDSRGLAPPRSPFAQRAPSPRSVVSVESSDDDMKAHKEGVILDRSFSGGSSFSQSPLASPTAHFMARSPSISSEISVGGTRLPRPAFNFSRPMSRASMNGLPTEIPSRQASSDSQPSFILADETAHTPVSMHSEGFPEVEPGGTSTYVYSRFALPRGKMLQRNSLIFQDAPSGHWESNSANAQHNDSAPPSPPSRPSTSYKPSFDHERRSLDPGRPSTSHQSQSRSFMDTSRPSYDHNFEFGPPTLHPGKRPSQDRQISFSDRGRPSVEQYSPSVRSSSPSAASSATIKARSQPSIAPSSEASGEEHVTKAIEYHEAGALTKSTYHLRLAARQNHPTGMLLYALACRHGWGMRPNQKEGVQWLRRAVDCAGLEVADDEDLIKDGKSVDFLERKARKAQFALSVYELGVSHMNGWGIEQDKGLALRCFEIAGSWGDADALAEAGFCYAQGIGCKKDLKKSASLYRQAEAKGISMVGNSWIYKDKYAADPSKKEERPEVKRSGTARSEIEGVREEVSSKKKPRDKSRTRTIFGRIIKS